jgi:hypothetical protein
MSLLLSALDDGRRRIRFGACQRSMLKFIGLWFGSSGGVGHDSTPLNETFDFVFATFRQTSGTRAKNGGLISSRGTIAIDGNITLGENGS